MREGGYINYAVSHEVAFGFRQHATSIRPPFRRHAANVFCGWLPHCKGKMRCIGARSGADFCPAC